MKTTQICYFIPGACMLLCSFHSPAKEAFDLSLLDKSQNIYSTDAELFNQNNDTLPGVYTLNISVNDNDIGTHSVTFDHYDNQVQPLFTCEALKKWGFAIQTCSAEPKPLNFYISASSVNADTGEGELDITVPQAMWLEASPSDLAEEKDWNAGINAIYTNYDIQAEKNTGGQDQTAGISGVMNNGINLNGFYFRNNGFLSYRNNSPVKYESSESHVSHDIDRIRGSLIAGDFYTSGILFPSLSLRGAAITTNDEMYSSEERDYAPVITGIAQSNATVTIRQNSYVIATRRVTPGSFALKDIPAAQNSGDLFITVTEANGSQHSFYQPYNNIAFMAPEKNLKYYFYSGRSRQGESGSRLLELNSIYGLNTVVTVLNGIQISHGYRNLASGFAGSLEKFGALSTTLNFSRSDLSTGKRQQGRTLNIAYRKHLSWPESELAATFERKLDPGYRNFADVSSGNWRSYRESSSVQLRKSFKNSSVDINYYRSVEWSGAISHRTVAGVYFNLAKVSVSTTLSRQYSQATQKPDNMIMVSVGLPFHSKSNNYLSYNHTQHINSKNNNGDQLSLMGNMGDNQDIDYNLNISNYNHEQQVDTSLTYNSSRANLTSSVSHTSNGQQYIAGLQGAALLHHYGITFSQQLGQSSALIHTGHETGIITEDGLSAETDIMGNTIIPDIQPYHYKNVSVYSNRDDVSVDGESLALSPREGAIIEYDYDTHQQHKQFAHIRDKTGKPLPFGSIVYDSQKNNMGIVANSGLTLLNLASESWPLYMNSEDPDKPCYIQSPKKRSEKIWQLTCQ